MKKFKSFKPLKAAYHLRLTMSIFLRNSKDLFLILVSEKEGKAIKVILSLVNG